MHKRRLFIAVGLVVVSAALGGVALLWPLDLRDADTAAAVRSIVAWIVDGKRVPGFAEDYPDVQFMPKQKRFFVVCDFLPEHVQLSSDPRVRRISSSQYGQVFQECEYNDTAYIVLELKSEWQYGLTIELSNMFRVLAGHGYRFVFRRTMFGLRAKGSFLWVS